MLIQRQQAKLDQKPSVEAHAIETSLTVVHETFLSSLPDELWLKIFNYLEDADLRRLAQVSRELHEFVNLHFLNTISEVLRFDKWQQERVNAISSNFETLKAGHTISMTYHPKDRYVSCLGFLRKGQQLFLGLSYLSLIYCMVALIKQGETIGAGIVGAIIILGALAFCLARNIANEDNDAYRTKPITEHDYQELINFLAAADGFVPENALSTILHPADNFMLQMSADPSFPNLSIRHTTVGRLLDSLENIVFQMKAHKVVMSALIKSSRATLKRTIEDITLKSSPELRAYALRTFSRRPTTLSTDVVIDIPENVNKKGI